MKPEAEPPRRAVPPNLSGRGLLDLQDTFPLAILHLQLPNNTLEVLGRGQGQIDVNFTWSNSFAIDDRHGTFVVDAETYRFELGGWYALLDDFYIGGALPVIVRDQGILDPLVEGFHNTFGFSDGKRSLRSTNSYEIRVTDEEGTHDLERGAGLGDLVLKTHWNLNPGDQWFPAVSLQALMGIPTSMSGFGSNGPDFGLSLSFAKTLFRKLHLYGVLGGTYFTDPRTEDLQYQKVVYQGAAGIEYAVIKKLSLLFQIMSYGPLLESPHPLDVRRTYLAWGLKWEFLRGFELQLSAVENLTPYENSADISFATGFSFRL